jgi:hypothetical protein
MSKTRTLIIAAILGLGATAFAQDPTVIGPTTGDGPDAIAKGGDTASVQQTITLNLPKATALHLDVTNLVFDLTRLDGTDWAERARTGQLVDFGSQMVCVYGLQETDATTQLGDNFYSQVQYLPLGTSYSNAGWPRIKVNGGAVVNTFPPIRLDKDGRLVPGSKNYFVCYRTFLLQKFSNGKSWDLTVQRVAGRDEGALKNIYIQDNPCDTFGAATGLYKIGASGNPIHLVPKNLSFGPTGSRTPNARERCGYKSWLDDLVVVALTIDGEYAGKNTATLQYTLQTTAWND